MSWRVVEIKNFLKERKGRYKPNDKEISGLHRIEKIDFSGNIFLSDKPSKTNMILVKNGDLVISGINVEKGAMAVYNGNNDVKATIHYSSYEYDKNKIDLDFLKHFLKSAKFKDALKEQVPGGIKTEIKPKHILPLKVFIPTEINEQKKVVEYLNEQNSLIENQSTELTHQLSLVKQLRQAFLREAMQGKLTNEWRASHPELVEGSHSATELLAKIKAEKEQLIKEKKIRKQKPLPPISEDEIPFEIPESWLWCKLGELCFKITDGFHNTPPKVTEGFPYIAATHVKTDSIDWKNCHYVAEKYHRELYNKAYPQKGELLVVNIGAGCGTPAIIDVDFEFSFKNTAILKFNQQLFSNRLLNYYFVWKRDEIYDELTKGGLQPFLSLTIINNINIPLAPLSEQQRIVEKLDELMAYCDNLEESIKNSKVQNEMFLGQVLREALEPEEKELVV